MNPYLKEMEKVAGVLQNAGAAIKKQLTTPLKLEGGRIVKQLHPDDESALKKAIKDKLANGEVKHVTGIFD